MSRIVALILAAALTGCSLLPEVQDPTKNWSAQKLYTEAKTEMGDGNYGKAVKYFEQLEARYPYGRFAQQSQLEVAYAHYKDGDQASALAACNRFIKLHPNHPFVDYAYYLKGLVNFNDDLGLIGHLSNQDMSERDPKASREAFETFRELVTKFPNSKYAPDAVARMKYLVNTLALYEVHVARYYFKRGAYVATVNRAQYTLQNYPQAPATEEALAWMVKSYDALGMTALKDDSLRILQKNFPQTIYTRDSFEADKPWWRLW